MSAMDLINISDYEQAAHNKLIQASYDYVAGGAEDELTLQENLRAFQRIKLRQRVLVDVSSISLQQTVLGEKLDFPMLLAPISFHKLVHPDGELGTARAAAYFNTIMILSTSASYTIEEVAKASSGTKWFQLYWYKDREITKDFIDRAVTAGYKALCLTVDLPILGHRERNLYNDFALPAHVSRKNLEKYASKGLQEFTSQTFVPPNIDSSITWKDLDWLRSQSNLPLLLKGVQTKEDAKLAIDHDIEGIIVSNHGGRQLDSSVATIDSLPEVVDIVNDRAEVLVDSGIRRGSDILKALALGAKAVLIGRPYIWGLAVDGETGV